MKKIIAKLESLKAGTIVRTILQILAYINQFVALLGSTTFADNPVYQWISFGFTIVITAVSYWYNNDWSRFAQMSGDVFDMLKDGKITQDELTNFINKYKKTKTNTEEKVKEVESPKKDDKK
jgi:SPP1 family holin